MNILFLGLMSCEDSLEEAYKTAKCGVAMAPHKFQTNIIRGLELANGEEPMVVNIPPTGSFPINNRQLFSRKYRWSKQNVQIGYINLPYFKHFQQKILLKKIIEEQIKTKDDLRIIVYSLYEPFVSVIHKLKKKYPQLKVYLLQTDAVSGRNDMEKYMTPKAKRRGDMLVKKSKCMDGFIVLSKYLPDVLEADERPYTIVECVCDQNQSESKKTDGKNKICLYMGTLEKSFSICELAEAFVKAGEGELWICGKGDAEERIKELSASCDRIKYFGYVTAEKGNELRDACDYLINPRRPSGTYTLYSFPSKTVEYMMSGKPTIMYKLEAVPDEYDEYLNYFKSFDVDGISEELKEIFHTDYGKLLDKATRARRFVLEEKSPLKQGEKILELIGK